MLYTTCYPEGEFFTAPMDVYLDDENLVQPDLLFVRNENRDRIGKRDIIGPPDWITEILSPATAKRDKLEKKYLYERFGVAEYWIADPEYHIIEVFTLQKSGYEWIGTYGKDDTIHSSQFPCMRVNMNELIHRLTN